MSALLESRLDPVRKAQADASISPSVVAELPVTIDDPHAPNFCSAAGPTVVYCGIPKRADFDKLALPARDGGIKEVLAGDPLAKRPRQLLLKSMEANGVLVIFQHWGFPVEGGAA